MPRSYAAAWNATNTQSATVPIMTVTGATTFRLQLYEVIMGSDAAPADNAASFTMRRHTTAISGGTTVTPAALDPADPASLASAMEGPSISAPTLTANTSVLQWAQNQRTPFRWVSTYGKEIIVPATANNGLSLIPTVATSAVNFAGTWYWTE